MCNSKSVHLFLDSTKRSRGSLQKAVFDLPFFNGKFAAYKRAHIQVVRFQPLATLTDVDESLVLRLTGGPTLEDTYDSVLTNDRGEYASSDVIAVQSQYQIRSGLAGSYRTMTTPLEPIPLSGNPLGTSIELTISTLGVNGYVDANLPGTTDAREFYAVIRLVFQDDDKTDEE